MKPDEVEPGTFVAPNVENPWPVAAPVKPDADVAPIVMDRDMEHRVPSMNLLQAGSFESAHGEKEEVGAVTTEAVVPLPLAPVQNAVAKRKRWPFVVGALVIVLVGVGVVGYFVFLKKPASINVTAARHVTTTPSPTASPTPTPTPTMSSSPTATPIPTPVPQTVTAPTVVPTSSRPQTVTITSKSGLWLRSSPNSSSRNNIIGWMPSGAEVSVDSTGSFWWHGTYKGKPGYFASKFTQ